MIIIFSAVSSTDFKPPEKLPPIEALRKPGPKPPSQFAFNFLIFTVSYVIATFIETFIFAQKKEEEIIKSKNETLQTELKLLKSQINPHFLFNSLNNIYALSVIDSNKTQQSISYLSDMLRYVLYECEQQFVPLQKEITYIENYIRLFSLKSSEPYPIKTEFNISNYHLKIASMLFIPFVENALKHSNIEKRNGSFIRIFIDDTIDNNVQFKIENSVPKQMVNKDKVGGIGLENVKKRLDILYQESHTLIINSTPEIFQVELNIKIHGED
ncbi:sensor histidine kinase [Aquimarina addita]|uniref:sensor histidine kinase n=1 Tax=Aquimarina addita TaxID=870485 RepID=UPI0031F0C9D4